jgi:RND family efflux transporter MFP subunit
LAISIVLALTVALGALLRLRAAAAPLESEPTLLPVAVTPVQMSSRYQVRRRFTGRVVPRRRSDVGFELAGLVESIAVDEGDTVTEGQVLARLDGERLAAREQELAARRDEIRAQLTLARTRVRREHRLVSDQLSSQDRLDEVRSRVGALTAQIKAAEAALRSVRNDLADTRLRAPYAGVVVRRLLDEGTVVRAGQPLLRIHEAGPLEARIGIPMDLRGRVVVGSRVQIEINGIGASARVRALIPDVQTRTRTLTAILELPELPGLAAQELVRLELTQTVHEHGFWLPVTALSEGPRDLWTVFVASPAGAQRGRIQRTPVEVLHTEAERVFARGPLQAGDPVVAGGTHRVVPGQLVRLIGADATERLARAGSTAP